MCGLGTAHELGPENEFSSAMRSGTQACQGMRALVYIMNDTCAVLDTSLFYDSTVSLDSGWIPQLALASFVPTAFRERKKAPMLLTVFPLLADLPPSLHLHPTSSTSERGVVIHGCFPHSSPKPVQPVSQSAEEGVRMILIPVEVPESCEVWLQSWYNKHVVAGQIRSRGSRACMTSADVVCVTAHVDACSAAGSLLTAGMRAVLTTSR